MKYSLEIHAAEGGEDSALFVKDLAYAYIKTFQRLCWIHHIALEISGKFHIVVTGDNLTQLLQAAGGYRLQRVPPTERKGRVHTSTVTVAVIDTDQYKTTNYSFIEPKDLKIEWYSGTGCGGQYRNKHQNSCRLTHIETGVMRTAQCRSRESSYKNALEELIRGLQETANSQNSKSLSIDRKNQRGSGMRGDKEFTFRFQDNIAMNHKNGDKHRLDKIMKGYLDILWN